MLTWMSCETRKTKITNEDIRHNLAVAPITNENERNRLRWSVQVNRRPEHTSVRKSDRV